MTRKKRAKANEATEAAGAGQASALIMAAESEDKPAIPRPAWIDGPPTPVNGFPALPADDEPETDSHAGSWARDIAGDKPGWSR